MDRYRFPHITRIEQCLEAIKGRDDFVVAERDGHTIINYYMMGSDTFPPITHFHHQIRRECRGIVFDDQGNIISRRLHKFFNVNERPEVELKGIDFKVPHTVLEKLDGSMITPIPIRNHIRWGTKMGLTGVGFQAEEFVSTRKPYLDFAEYCVEHHLTPIFEWCSRKQRIVLDYPKDDLILLAIRNTYTGEYLPYANMVGFGKFWKVPVVSSLGLGAIENPAEFVDGVQNNQHDGLMEGFVVRFDDGHSIKIKTADYVRIHRAKDSILQEKRVVEMIANEKVDDVLPHLIDHDKKALEDFRDAFWHGLLSTKKKILVYTLNWHRDTGGDRKRFAIETTGVIDGSIRSVMFAVWDVHHLKMEQAIFDELVKRVLKNVGSGTMIESNRWIWQDAKWADYIKAEDETN